MVSHAISSKNLDSVINYASLKLGNCLILCDKNFTIISHSSYIPVTDPIWKENIEKGYKSLAFRIKMQDENATLTDEVIERQMSNVRAKLQKTYAEISFRE